MLSTITEYNIKLIREIPLICIDWCPIYETINEIACYVNSTHI